MDSVALLHLEEPADAGVLLFFRLQDFSPLLQGGVIRVILQGWEGHWDETCEVWKDLAAQGFKVGFQTASVDP